MSSDGCLRIVHLLAPGAFGGAESVVRMLTSGLADRGHEVRLVLSLDQGEVDHPLLAALDGSAVEVVPIHLPEHAYAREVKLVRRICAERCPHVLHTHGYRADLVGLLASWSKPIGRVTTVHGFTGGGRKNRVYEHVQRRTHAFFDAIIAVSRPLRHSLVAAGGAPERVLVLPNAWLATDALLERQEARAALGLRGADFIVGWVGRISAEKGADTLLEAAAILAKQGLRFVIVGAGDRADAWRLRARELGVSDQVQWVGPLVGAGRVFRAFDLYVLSSRTEGTPIVLFEAMASGVPVVATAVGGVPDVVSAREALLVPPDDPTELARAIERCVEDPSGATERAERAMARLGTEFSAEDWLDRHEEIYARVAARRKATNPR